MRSLPALSLLPLLAACTSLSSDEQAQLASYQRNAGLYFDGGKYDQALGLVERGLAIDADDYKLRSMQASIHLRLSGPVAGQDQRLLDQSLTEFEAVFSERSLAHHDRHLLFYYALCRQKQALRRFAEAARVDPKLEDAIEQRHAIEADANAQLAGAEELLQELLSRGEIPRLCHYHLLQVAALTNDGDAILLHGEQYLAAAAADQQRTSEELERTNVYGYEVDRKNLLRSLREEEIAVRTTLAQQLYARRDFTKALTHVDAVLAIDPTRSDDHYNRGLILRELGRHDESKADLRTFLATTALPPDSPKVTDAVRALAQ